jgi:hypothetical protein
MVLQQHKQAITDLNRSLLMLVVVVVVVVPQKLVPYELV